MITRMDLEIGKVLTQLRDMDAERDTVVVFLSDNGAVRATDSRDVTTRGSTGSARSSSGWTGLVELFERAVAAAQVVGKRSGIASPLIVHWPAGYTMPTGCATIRAIS